MTRDELLMAYCERIQRAGERSLRTGKIALVFHSGRWVAVRGRSFGRWLLTPTLRFHAAPWVAWERLHQSEMVDADAKRKRL